MRQTCTEDSAEYAGNGPYTVVATAAAAAAAATAAATPRLNGISSDCATVHVIERWCAHILVMVWSDRCAVLLQSVTLPSAIDRWACETSFVPESPETRLCSSRNRCDDGELKYTYTYDVDVEVQRNNTIVSGISRRQSSLTGYSSVNQSSENPRNATRCVNTAKTTQAMAIIRPRDVHYWSLPVYVDSDFVLPQKWRLLIYIIVVNINIKITNRKKLITAYCIYSSVHHTSVIITTVIVYMITLQRQQDTACHGVHVTNLTTISIVYMTVMHVYDLK